MAQRLTADSANPALAASAVRSVFVATCAAAASGVVLAAALEFDAAYPLRAAAAFLIGTAFVLPVLVKLRHPFAGLGPANRISIARGVLTALIAALIGEPFTSAAGYFALAAGALCLVLDGVDGRLARSTGMSSELGARLDMETDALLAVILSLLAWQVGKAGAGVLLCGLLRYLFIAAARIVPLMRRPLPESRRRKTICVAMLIGLLAALAPFIPTPWSTAIAAAATLLLSYSFLVDTLWLLRQVPSSR